MLNLEKINTKDPVEFWETIKKRGRKAKQDIPHEVYDENGEVKTDLESVLNALGCQILKLYLHPRQNLLKHSCIMNTFVD